MNYCEIKDSAKGQALKNMSGLSEFSAYSFISNFENKNKRFPELDEIPDADSKPYLDKYLNIKKNKNTEYIKAKTLLEKLNTLTVEEANVRLNTEYSDLEIHLNLIGDSIIINTLHRPSEYNEVEDVEKDIDYDGTTESNAIIIENALNRLLKFYGLNIISITSEQLASDPKFLNLPIYLAEAFIYNGNIYVNTDKASIDAPIHELLHLFLGSIRFNHPQLYFQLVNMTELLPNFRLLRQQYPNRTMSDVLEEIFVTELAKFLIRDKSLFDSVDPSIMNFVLYNIKRDIDSIVFGKNSVKTIENPFQYSLLLLGSKLGSDNFDLDTAGTIDDAAIHRILANTKEELMENNELIENCI